MALCIADENIEKSNYFLLSITHGEGRRREVVSEGSYWG
jgi:hypothetical protein